MVLFKKEYGAPLGYEQVASVAAAQGLTPPAHTRVAYVSPEGGDVRWRDDGTNPTAAVGMPLASGQTMEYVGDMSALKFIDNGGTAKLNVVYYK